jgi:hypothetical protein
LNPTTASAKLETGAQNKEHPLTDANKQSGTSPTPDFEVQTTAAFSF